MASPWLSLRLVLDRVLAVITGVAIAPLIAVLALLVRKQDGERGLIKVKRIGRDGVPFDMWKIRSMTVLSGDGRAGGAALTASADNRVTPIGRKLRALHLDELPQIYNVAKGEMGLLGPRPEAPEFVDPSDPMWKEVLSVQPGIAGPTQIIVGEWEKSVIDLDETGDAYLQDVVPVKLAIDRWYVRRATPLGDLLVLSSLVVNALERDAKALKKAVARSVPEAIEAINFAAGTGDESGLAPDETKP